MTSALADLRVIDVGHVLAGPFAATLLGDLGADVIKIEPPEGDGLRRLGPRKDGRPIWWSVAARNKRCVTLDLRVPEGQEVLVRLARVADVLIENFRPGTMERWNVGWERLHRENPRLIMLRISGYGQQSAGGGGRPMFGRPSEALSGLLHLTGFGDGPPLHAGFSLGDASTGLMGAFGVLAALHDRERSGEGQVVDLALFETLFRMIEWHIPMYDQLGVVTQRAGNRFPLGLMVGNVYQSADGKWLSTSAAAENVVQRMLRLVGGDALARDPRFATPEARARPEHDRALDDVVREWIAARPAPEVVETFEQAGAVIALAHDAADIVDSLAYKDRDAIVTVDDPYLGPVRMPAAVPRLSQSPGAVRWPGPELGAHNEEVFCGLLAMTRDELEALRRVGAVG
ncbi:MAG: CoA transferase [Actinobacteria bacterium]|nr:MAG: CoA transferase [Actinomycetota bacterium]